MEGQNIRIILSLNLVAFSCIFIFDGDHNAWSINTEFEETSLLFLE